MSFSGNAYLQKLWILNFAEISKIVHCSNTVRSYINPTVQHDGSFRLTVIGKEKEKRTAQHVFHVPNARISLFEDIPRADNSSCRVNKSAIHVKQPEVPG